MMNENTVFTNRLAPLTQSNRLIIEINAARNSGNHQVKYSFLESLPSDTAYAALPSNTTTAYLTNVKNASTSEYAQFRSTIQAALDLWGTLIGVTFVNVTNTAAPLFRFGISDFAGSATRANETLAATLGFRAVIENAAIDNLTQDVYFSTASQNYSVQDLLSVTPGQPIFGAMLHEIGHALGLAHPHGANEHVTGKYGLLGSQYIEEDSTSYTVMAYPREADFGNAAPSIATPLLYDMAAIANYYGVRPISNAPIEWTLSEPPLVNSTIVKSQILLRTIYGGESNADSVNAAALTRSAFIDLRAGHFSVAGSTLFSFSNVAKRVAMKQLLFAQPADLANVSVSFDSRNGQDIENATGGSGADILIGNDVANVLDGGAGSAADVLIGGKGDDTLKGGAGVDQYKWFAGDGTDTIDDSDRQGKIYIDGTPISQQLYKSGNTYIEFDGRISISRNSSLTLNIQGGGAIALQAFEDADHGLLSIHEVTDPDIAATVRTILGGNESDGNGALPGIQHFDDGTGLGNWAVDAGTVESSFANTLNGSTASDLFLAGGGSDTINAAQSSGANATGDTIDAGTGDDTVSAGGGNDKVLAGAGNDTVTAGAGNDWLLMDAGTDYADAGAGDDLIEAGAGADIAFGGDGKDRMYADANVSLETLSSTPAQLNGTGSSATKGDWLDGGAGDDIMIGGADADLMLGGMGEDLLVGAGGNDNIYGDARTGVAGDPGFIALTSGWSAARSAASGVYTVTVTGGSIAANTGLTGDADAIYSGAGDDFIAAGAGDDYVDAGDGVDLVFGENGADVILLGDGNDTAYGDDGSLPPGLAGVAADDFIDGGAGSDHIVGGYGDDTLIGGTGDDTLVGGGTLYPEANGNDYMAGGDGVDSLTGGSGDDVLVGGKGDDYLDGRTGHDTYVFNKGDGSDTLDDRDPNTGLGNPDKIIVLGEGFDRDNIIFRRGSFEIDMGAGDALKIVLDVGATDPAMRKIIERIEFADGTSLNWDAIKSKGFVIDGTASGETIYGTVAVDHLYGYGGNDSIYGLIGDDILDGGAGNDTVDGGAGDDFLIGGAGDDSYQIGFEQGKDTVEDATGSNTIYMQQGLGDLALSRSDNDLVLSVRGATDSVTVKNGFAAGGTAGWTLNAGGTSIVLATYVGTGALANSADVSALTAQFTTRWHAYNVANNLSDTTPQTVTLDASANTSSYSGAHAQLNRIVDGAGGNDTLTITGAGSVAYYRGTPGGVLIGGTGDDTLTGGGDDDILTGGTGNNTLDGGFGEDHYVLFAGAGTDTIVDRGGLDYQINNDSGVLARYQAGTGGFDRVYLPTGVTAAGLTYSWSDEAVRMERNSAVAHGAQGAAPFNLRVMTAMLTLTWGDGTQSVKIAMPHSDDPADFGIEEVRFSDGSFMTRAQLIGAAPVHDLDPNAAGTTITADNLDAEAGNDTLTGNGILRGGEGNDVVTGGAGRDAISGDEGADTLVGGAGADLIGFGMREFLGAGNTVTGGTGNDILLGTVNADTFVFNSGDGIDSIGDYLRNPGNSPFAQGLLTMPSVQGQPTWTGDYIDVQSYLGALPGSYTGYDTLTFGAGIAPSSVSFVRAAALDYAAAPDPNPVAVASGAGDDLVLSLSATDQVRLGGWYKTTRSVWSEAQEAFVDVPLERSLTRVTFADGTVWSGTYLDARSNNPQAGTSGNDTLAGTAGADWITGLAGNDTLNGGAGNDYLDGGTGVDAMTGGSGDDTYVVDNGSDSVTENVGEGTDTVESSISWALAAPFENLTLTGVAAINGYGNTQANVIVGNAGNNLLDGGAGADSMAGGGGDDSYFIDDAGDHIIESAGAGTDLVWSSVAYTLEANVEWLFLSGSANLSISGNALDNWINGNAGNNILTDGVGNDALDGRGGADQMAGGIGNDLYFVDDIGDIIVENLNEGEDEVFSSVSYTLADNVDYMFLTGSGAINATGNTLHNWLNGNTGDNLIDGGAGADDMMGGAGNDTYVIDNTGDTANENAGEGTDTVRASLTWTLAANLENLVLTGAAAINGYGNTQNNVITGNAGANILDGAAGADSLIGGAGDDTYYLDNAGDHISENVGEGTDTVWSSVAYTLEANVDWLFLTGSANLTIGGNGLDNWINGNSGNNILTDGAGNDALDGRGGVDQMAGGAGNDIYFVDDVGDTIVENLSEGEDEVFSTVSYTLPANVDYLFLTGSTNLDVTGNALHNWLNGNSGDNLIDGGAGADDMMGGAGNDTYIIDDSGDTANENPGAGTDTVRASLTWTLGANLENLVLTGATAINGTGNTQNNVITGNTGNNVLDGGAGADTMAGGAGDDVYIVDNVGDVVTENAGEGTGDYIVAYASHTLEDNVETLIVYNGASGTGNGADNVLQAQNDAASNQLSGGDGNDFYIIGGNDVVTETSNGGAWDVIAATSDHTLEANVEAMTMSNGAAGTGNGVANSLYGCFDAAANTLTGLAGNDTYWGARGMGADTIVENDATAGNTDVAQFLAGVANDQIWFRHVNNDLEASILGTADKFVVKDWYSGSQTHVEQIKTTDNNKSLSTSQQAFADLVQAMAAVTPNANATSIAGVTMSQSQRDSINSLMAANWQ